MHIGFLTFESPFGTKGGGVASYLRAMIPTLVENGHRVTLIAPVKHDDVPNPYADQVRMVPVHLPNAHWYLSKLPLANRFVTLPVRELEWSYAFRAAIRRAMQDDPMDVVEASELGAWAVAKDSLVPLVVRLHGSEYTFRRHTGEPSTAASRWNRQLQRQTLERASAVTSPSTFQATEVAQEMSWPPERISVVPNAIAHQVLDAANESTSTDPETGPLILYTGRLALVKGTPILLEAAANVLKQFPHARFVLAGPWQLPASSGDWSQVAGGSRQISWLGPQSQHQLAELYRQADVFVMPSHYETFGISCLEAMAFQLPVVATRAGALPEVVEHDRVGITVRPGDSGAFAEAICKLLRNAELRRRLGAAGRERVLSQFTPDAVRESMLAVYQLAQDKPR
jgi:glycosyltransferase involved in cell wall biosynthesis